MRSTMMFLSVYSGVGTISLIILVNVLHLYISHTFMVKARRKGIDIAVSAYIPVFNLLVPIRVFCLQVKEKRQAKRELLHQAEETNTEVFSDDDEIIL